MTSPALDKPLRSHEEARWDYDHRMNTDKLRDLEQWLRNPGKTLETMTPFLAPYADAVDYAMERLHNEQARVLLERTRT